MEEAVKREVPLSQKDIGVGIVLLGISFLIPGYFYLRYASLLFGITAIVFLLYRRHRMSVKQGRSLYTGILIFAVSILAYLFVSLYFIFSIAEAVVMGGYTSSNIPATLFDPVVNFAMYGGISLSATTVFSYFIVVYFYAEKGMKLNLIFLSVASFVFKVAGITFSVISIREVLGNTSIGTLTAAINGNIMQPLVVAISVVSGAVLRIFIIYLGITVRSGRLMPLPTEEKDMF